MQNSKCKILGFVLLIAIIFSFSLFLFDAAYAQAQKSGEGVFVDKAGRSSPDLPTFESGSGYIKKVTEAGYGPHATKATLTGVIGAVIKGALTLVGAIFLIMMVYGGYNWMIDRGDSEHVKIAKDTITRAIIGIIIVLGAYAITTFVTERLIKASIGEAAAAEASQ